MAQQIKKSVLCNWLQIQTILVFIYNNKKNCNKSIFFNIKYTETKKYIF